MGKFLHSQFMYMYIHMQVFVYTCTCTVYVDVHIHVHNYAPVCGHCLSPEPDLGMEPGLAHHFFLQLLNGVVSCAP